MVGTHWIASMWLALLVAAPARAAEPCPAGRFVVVEGVLLPEAGASREFVVLGADTLTVTGGCPDIAARLRARRNGVTRVRAVWWTASPCAGLAGKAALTGKIVETCARFEGKLVARKASPRKRPFVALRSTCGDGIADAGAGEACDGADAAGCPNGCQTGCACAPFRGLFAITDANVLVRFSSTMPATLAGIAFVSGLETGETIVGIDFRPATGELYGVGIVDEGATDTARLYRIDAATAVATLVGPPITGVTDGSAWGVDFNPVADRVRVVNDADENLRINPNTGTRSDAATNDMDLNPPGTRIEAVAYSNSVAGATVTTLYGISYQNDTLYVIDPPNVGTLTLVGSLTVVSVFDSIGFDIDGLTGTAFATIGVAGLHQLYTVDLTTGAATPIGVVGNGLLRLPGLAVAPGGPVI